MWFVWASTAYFEVIKALLQLSAYKDYNNDAEQLEVDIFAKTHFLSLSTICQLLGSGSPAARPKIFIQHPGDLVLTSEVTPTNLVLPRKNLLKTPDGKDTYMTQV